MKKRNIILIVSLILIVIPFLINSYHLYKLILLMLGIILLDVFFAMSKKINIFLLIYLPILLLIFTYSIDYMKTYMLDMSPIYVLENKINNNVSIYNSLLYRVYRCENKYIFDNDYKMDFPCENNLLKEIDINDLLKDTQAYRKYHRDFIKVTGKISKIRGNSKLELQEYELLDNSLNGYVQFKDDSKLVINLNEEKLSGYKIYDYITVIGLLDSYEKEGNTYNLINGEVVENNLYNDYEIEVVESNKCDKEVKDYSEDIKLLCLDNVYIDYKVDRYELSYTIKDGKISFADLYKKGKKEEKLNYTLYDLEKFKIVKCTNDKNILVNKNLEIPDNICETN